MSFSQDIKLHCYNYVRNVDKVYRLAIEPTPQGYRVKYANGRRNSANLELLRTASYSKPLSLQDAFNTWEDLVREKLNKGYHHFGECHLCTPVTYVQPHVTKNGSLVAGHIRKKAAEKAPCHFCTNFAVLNRQSMCKDCHTARAAAYGGVKMCPASKYGRICDRPFGHKNKHQYTIDINNRPDKPVVRERRLALDKDI